MSFENKITTYLGRNLKGDDGKTFRAYAKEPTVIPVPCLADIDDALPKPDGTKKEKNPHDGKEYDSGKPEYKSKLHQWVQDCMTEQTLRVARSNTEVKGEDKESIIVVLSSDLPTSMEELLEYGGKPGEIAKIRSKARELFAKFFAAKKAVYPPGIQENTMSILQSPRQVDVMVQAQKDGLRTKIVEPFIEWMDEKEQEELDGEYIADYMDGIIKKTEVQTEMSFADLDI